MSGWVLFGASPSVDQRDTGHAWLVRFLTNQSVPRLLKVYTEYTRSHSSTKSQSGSEQVLDSCLELPQSLKVSHATAAWL
jgi:hypothetical protein